MMTLISAAKVMIVLAVWLLLLRAHRVAGSDHLGESFFRTSRGSGNFVKFQPLDAEST